MNSIRVIKYPGVRGFVGTTYGVVDFSDSNNEHGTILKIFTNRKDAEDYANHVRLEREYNSVALVTL